MNDSRLPPHPSQLVDQSSKVAFSFNGKPVSAAGGDTIGSALYASGTRIFSRSFKYHRPRGPMCMAGDCPNCLMTVDGSPNVRTCTTSVHDGMTVETQNAWPSVKHDVLSVLDKLDRFMPVGFYYKSLIHPRFMWNLARRIIRRLAGLGKVGPDHGHDKAHQHHNLHSDVAVVGGGPAGLSAAIEAGKHGARVILIDEGPALGGHLITDVSEHPELEEYDGLAGYQIAAKLAEEIQGIANIKALSGASAFGLYPGNLLGISQGKRLIKLRSKNIIIAAGCREVPLVFPGNDLPGVFLGGALQRLVHLYGIRPGRRALVVTGDDRGYRIASELHRADVKVVGIIDMRNDRHQQTTTDGIPVFANHTVMSAEGAGCVKGAVVSDRTTGQERRFDCDLIAVAGGYDPNVSLLGQSSSKATYDQELQEVVPGPTASSIFVAGDVTGIHDLQLAVMQGKAAGIEAAQSSLESADAHLEDLRKGIKDKEQQYRNNHTLASHHIIPDGKKKSFLCYCEDVTPKDLRQAIEEGFDEMQTLKRYSTISMGPCQGKMCLKSSVELCARYTGQTIEDTGTTTSRPPLRPLTLGTLAGASHMPIKRTPLHEKHVQLGAKMMDLGPWKRPHSYGPTMAECAAVRERVGIIDVSTLGKIDVCGPDAPVILDKVYTHTFSTLPVGRIRYSLLCSDNGTIMDDGTITRLAEDHYFITTTTGNIDLMDEWLKWWVAGSGAQVHINNVTSGYGAINVAGPKARDTLVKLTDIDLSREGFRYMRSSRGEVAGVPALLLRIGFVGETGWEVHFAAEYGEHIWDALMEAGEEFGIRPFGVEAQRVLRLAKKHIILGQDTDMVSNPLESDLDWVVRFDKDDFIGKHALEAVGQRGLRDKLVGFVMEGQVVPEDGVPVMHNNAPVGKVTSSRADTSSGRGFGLVWVPVELSEAGSRIHIQVQGKPHPAQIMHEPFYDPEGKRLRE